MGKKYYPIENAINNITKRLNLSLQDSKNMNEEELLEAENIISDYTDILLNAIAKMNWQLMLRKESARAIA